VNNPKSTDTPRLRRDDRLTYKHAPNLDIWVTRAAKDGTWVDIYVRDRRTLTSWTKRQRLPLADGIELLRKAAS
jgi:hypothetical protein